ncbi:LysR family transcriptional regulator [Pseudomonas sp. RIT-PI-q]|uniref:LysR family transcriptional regulator n=1 Tax=Pseudomonas sp. RIT-PI-q TaxID=1690247 RepID=UPI0006CD03EA|nr:LysR family transcriptional regulator [Pseudomonas sp. RIT-PI-q]KPH00940.1 LysR family transcriptional regulator [Pseudomonas sp. RIT-PI-q]
MSAEPLPIRRLLDLDAVQAFVLVAEMSSFTRAAEVLESTQSAISLKLKRLEKRLGKRLLERTPRRVKLSAEGAQFLIAARELLNANDRAVGLDMKPQRRLRIGLIDHTATDDLIPLLELVSRHDPSLRVEVRIGASSEMLAAYDVGELDAAFARLDTTRNDAEKLFEEACGWFASPLWVHNPSEPLRIASLSAPCGVRASALKALDESGIAWTEVFVGGGITTVGAAVMAAMAVAPMTLKGRPSRSVEVGSKLGLPALPGIEIAVYTRVRDQAMKEAVRIFGASLRAAASST